MIESGRVNAAGCQLLGARDSATGYLLSSLDIFYFSGWLLMLLIPLCWIIRRPAAGTIAAAAE